MEICVHLGGFLKGGAMIVTSQPVSAFACAFCGTFVQLRSSIGGSTKYHLSWSNFNLSTVVNIDTTHFFVHTSVQCSSAVFWCESKTSSRETSLGQTTCTNHEQAARAIIDTSACRMDGRPRTRESANHTFSTYPWAVWTHSKCPGAMQYKVHRETQFRQPLLNAPSQQNTKAQNRKTIFDIGAQRRHQEP
eukprot:785654-Amphidinium_carterae.1